MKALYRLLFLTVMVSYLPTTHLTAQSRSVNWTDMSKEKEQHFIHKALELIKEFGPGYYRPEAEFDIAENEYSLDGRYENVLQNNGRMYYIVGFYYDWNDERFKDPFLASVRFWKDTEEPWNITFGNGKKILFLTEPYRKIKGKREIVPFELDTLKMKELQQYKERMKKVLEQYNVP